MYEKLSKLLASCEHIGNVIEITMYKTIATVKVEDKNGKQFNFTIMEESK